MKKLNNSEINLFKIVYFQKIQIEDNLSGGKYKLLHRIKAIPYFLKAFFLTVLMRINGHE